MQMQMAQSHQRHHLPGPGFRRYNSGSWAALRTGDAMALTPEQRAWLLEQKQELNRELDKLVANKIRPAHVDKNERRIELLDELGEVERQLREDQQ